MHKSTGIYVTILNSAKTMPAAGILVTPLNCLFFSIACLDIRENPNKFRHDLLDGSDILNKNGFFYTLNVRGKICLNLFLSR